MEDEATADPALEEIAELDDLAELGEEDIARLVEEGEIREVVTLDTTGVKQLVLGLEKKINKNQRLRVKYADQPMKFMESELELNEEVSGLSVLAAAPQLYPQLVALNAVTSLLGLLAHENTDVSLAVIALLSELTAPDAMGDTDDGDALIDALVGAQGLELLVQNLSRLDEASAEDAQGVYNTMHILENMTEAKPELCVTMVERTDVLLFLLRRLKAKRFDSTKLYCSEILSILLSADVSIQHKLGSLQPSGGGGGAVDGMDLLLQGVAHYRRRDPASSEEEELIQNLFDSLCTALMVPENQTRFRHSEGFELALRCVKEKRFARQSALKVIDFALSNNQANCVRFVAVGGLKTLFPAFMGRHKSAAKSKYRKHAGAGEEREEEEHVVAAVHSLVQQLSGAAENGRDEHDAAARLMAKLTETEFEKMDRLAELYAVYKAKVAQCERETAAVEAAVKARRAAEGEDEDSEEDEEFSAEAKYLKKLDAGLFTLQRITSVIAHVCCESEKAKFHLLSRLRREGSHVEDLRDTLIEYAESLGDDDTRDSEETQQQQARVRRWAQTLMEG